MLAVNIGFAVLPVLFVVLTLQLNAQQVEEFSLLRENAFTLNPALAGMSGWIHGTATFRKQFTQIDRSPYTAMYAMDGEIKDKHVGIGGYFIQDQTGPTGKTGVTVSVAYNLHIFKKMAARYTNNRSDHILSFGLSISAVQYRLRGDQLLLDNPDDPRLYENRGFRVYPDASAGIYYRYKQNFYVGFSVPQMLGLNINYRASDGNADINRVQHINVLIGGKAEFNRGNLALEPVASFRWVKGAPPQGDIGLRITGYKIFWLGANYRSLNYVVFEGGFNVKNSFFISYAYDFNCSKYRRDIGSTHEVSLSYTIPKSGRVWRGVGPVLRF